MTFHGLMTALVTPFRDGALDEPTFRALVRRQIDGGVDGLVPCGTTGEAPTLTIEEHLSVIRWTIEEAAGLVPVMAGIGSNSTATAVATARAAQELGVQGVLATAPYYNKPTQEGLFRHFAAVAEAVDVEVCLYDVPGRTGVRVLPETVARLSRIDNITCLKDATADMANASEVLRLCGDRVAVLSGDDFTTFPLIAIGGAGCISVASNVAPARMKSLISAARAGRLEEARERNLQLFPLFRALFLESNPIPVKAAMAQLGLLQEELRLPLSPMSEAPRQALSAALRDAGLSAGA
jgi:4-hydroxy-tetrahydrodipicolinate synthase